MITRQNDFINKVFNRCSFYFGLLLFFIIIYSNNAFVQTCLPVIEYTTPDGKLEGCSPFAISFKDPNSTFSRIWDFGDATPTSTSATPFHVFKAGKLGDTTYTVTLTKNCNNGTQTSIEIKVNAPPKVNFKVDTTSLCAITDKVTFTNLSDLGTYNWSFGDNTSSTLRNPLKIYSLGGLYDVKLTVKTSKGCEKDTTFKNLIRVNALPSPEFLLDKYSGCVPLYVNINNITDTNDVQIKEWNWNFNGEIPSSNAMHPNFIYFQTPGYKNISLSVKSDVGCTSTTSNVVHVITTPTSSFTLSKDAFCSSDSTLITFNGKCGPNAKYTWNYNGGTSQTIGAGPHWVKWSKGGIKSINLNLLDSTCNTSFSSNVTIQTSPVITLNTSTDTICDFEEVIFNAEPKSLVDYKFYKNGIVVQEGDKYEYSSDQIFDKDLFYVVGLDAKGCSSSKSNYKPIKVKVKPIVSLTSSDFDNIICDSDEVRFTGVPNFYKGYTFFNFSNPLQSGIASEFKTSSIKTNDSIFVEATNLNGCKKTSSNAFIYKVVERISKPVVHCGKSTNTQINFNWDPLPEAVGYEVSINGGAFQTPSTGSTSLTHLVTGLTDGEKIKLVVKALGSFSCGTSIASDTAVCYAKLCDPLPILYSPNDTICAGEKATLKITGLKKGNFSIAWNGEAPGYDSVYLVSPIKDAQFSALIVDSANLTNCSYFKAIFKIKVNEIPKVTISSDIPTTNCSGSTAIITATPPSYKRYTFYNGNQIIQDNWRNSVKIKSIKDGVPIKVVATNYGCSSTSNNIVNTVVKPLNQPVVNCGSSTTSSIEFKWDAVTDAIGYEVSVDGANWTTPSSGNTGLFHILNGLTPGSASYISVRAKGATICGNSPISLQASCFTLPCSSISFATENSKTLCEGQQVSLSVSNINIPNYAVSWNSKNFSKALNFTVKPKKDTIIAISVKNLNEQNCPATIKYTRLEVIKQPDVKLTVNPALLCNTDSLTLIATPVDYESYKFFNGSATLYSGSSSTFKLSMFKSSVSLKVVARNGVCTDTSDVLKFVIDKPLERPIINSGNITNSSIEFVWDSVPQATGYMISINGKPYTTPSSGILGKSHIISGLGMNESKYAKVIALGAGACGNSLESDTIIRKTTNHIDSVCTAITYKLTYHDSICDGDDFVARVTNINNNTSLLNWNESFEDTITVYQIAPFKTDTLSVTIRRTDEPLCPGVKKLVRITVNPKPNVTLSTSISNDSICEKKEITFFASPAGYENYLFKSNGAVIQNSNNNEYFFPTITKSESIEVQVTDDIGCIGNSSILPMTVVKNPIISLSADLKNGGACIGSDVIIKSTPTSYFTYNFYNYGNLIQSSSTKDLTINNISSSYAITANAIHKFGCVGDLTSILNVELFQLPDVVLSTDKLNNTICDEQNIVVTASPLKLKLYDFYDATTNSILQSTVSENYNLNSLRTSKSIYLIAKDSNDCVSKKSTTLQITVNPNPKMTSVSNLTICSNNLIEIPLTSDISSTYTWQASDNSLIKGESILIKSTDILKDSLKSEAINQETVTYSVKPTSLLGCIGATQTVSVKVNPTPVIQNVTDTICSGLNFNLVPTHQLPIGNIVPLNSSFTWPTPSYLSGTLIGPIEQTTNTKTISQKINNKSNVPIELIYQITPKSGTTGGCTGKPFEYKVLVKPTPEILSYTQDSICSSDSKTYLPKNGLPTSDNIVPSNTKYTWNTPIAIPNGSVEGMIAETVGSNQIDLNLTNPTTQFGRVVYSIIPTSDKCVGKAFEIPVVVKPLPLITNQLTKDFCGENKVNMKLTASVPSKFTWKAEDNTAVSGETLIETTKDSITDLLSNQTFNSQFVKYILKPESTYGCKGQEKELIIKIYEKIETLVLSTNKVNNTICDGDNIIVNAIPLKLKSYDFYDAITNTIVQSTSSEKYTLNTLNTSKSLYVIAKDSNNCFSKKSATLQVTVNPNPVMTSANSLTICSNDLIEIPLTSDVSSNYTWQATDNTSIKGESILIKSTNILKDTLKNESIIQETVNYTVKPTSLLGCPGTAQTITIKVNPTPVIKNVIDTLCSGSSFNLVPKHQIPTGNILPANTSFTWPIPSYIAGSLTGPTGQNTSTNLISQIIQNKTNTSIELIYQITPKSGAIGNCLGKAFEYKVIVKPTPVIENYIQDSICSGESKIYIPKNGLPTSSNIVPTSTKYTWNTPISVPNGTVEGILSETIGSNQISLQLTNSTTQFGKVLYTILPTADKCVGKSFEIPVVVKPTPLITSELNKGFCSENKVNIKLTTSITSKIAWKAEENNEIEGESLSELYHDSITDLLINKSSTLQTVKYSLKPISINGCSGAEKELLIQVFPKPLVKNTTMSMCNGDTLQFIPKDIENGNIVPTNTLFKWNVLEKNPSDSIIGFSNQATPISKIYQLLKTKTISGNIKYEVIPNSNIGGNCVGNPFNLIVNIHPKPDPKVVVSDTGICKGEEISINTTFDDTYFPSTAYSWNTGQNTKSFTLKPQQTTVYKLIATSNGCSSLPDSVSVFVDQTVPNVDAGSGVTICRGDSIELKAIGGKTYSWKFDKSLSTTSIANPKAAPYVTTKYYVTATNDFCSAEDEVLITIDRCLKELPFKIPQIFTPNQDGVNDVWELIDVDYFPKNNITIFNRWGDVVFEKTPYFNQWDGKNMAGDELPDGTYYYVIDLGNGHELYKGFVVITR